MNSTVRVEFSLWFCCVCPAASCANAASGVLPEVALVCLAWVGASSDAAVQRDVSASLEGAAASGYPGLEATPCSIALTGRPDVGRLESG